MHPLAPHTISLALQYTIPPSELPTHLVSRPLLQRHHFLSISPSDPSYLCWPHPGADPHKTVAALELLATQDHEQLVRTAQIRYQTAEPVYARVWLGDVVQLVFVWEEDEDGAGWRYFDADCRPIPPGCSPSLVSASSASTNASLEDDYWAGYDSDSPRSNPEPADEDAYWASYGTVHGSADSTVPSPAPQKHKQLDAWGREELAWEDMDPHSTAGHGLGVTILSQSRPPTPPSLPLPSLSTQAQPQLAPLPDLNHRNWNSPPSSLSAPFSALSEPDEALLDEPAESDKADGVAVPATGTADAALSNTIKGMYAMWLASRQDATSEDTKQAFLAVVRDALADA
ncbi:hypothetical protein CTheo_4344 [Ceratobasidium theobromae]|uniref:Uncharacterized protein n=1 Tax=Ceratobasidium theobromae TaxID=1582974 RepID=A0A5N5QKW6_9AGAM|nr:hypothetical protein CTheo_4344 [Ceratobasidium theobromae]